MNDAEMKTIVALSQAFDPHPAQQLNAIGHLAQAIGAAALSQGWFKPATYVDGAASDLATLSWWPLVVLTGRANKVFELWQGLSNMRWPKACFVEAMIHGGTELQLEATSALAVHDHKIVAVAAFGPTAELQPLTKRLSLWRPARVPSSGAPGPSGST